MDSYLSPYPSPKLLMRVARPGFMKNSTDPATATTTDHDQIKSTIEPFRQIFMTVLENILHECLSHFTEDRTAKPPVITLHPTGHPIPMAAKGRAAFSPKIPYDMQTAILNYSQCDLSIVCFLESIREALRPIGATVEWLLINSIQPLSILHYPYEKPNTGGIRHSVFAITTANREQYVADFTLEQFGYPAELWFLKKAEYAVRFAEVFATWCIASEQDMEANWETAHRDQRHILICTNAVCGEISWPSYRKLPADECMSWVEARAREIVGRFEGEDPFKWASTGSCPV
jgi:hypothetical protein